MRLLLVEDNPENRDMLARRLLRRGFQVEFAADGVQAIAAALASPPDLVLMDLSLPVMDGWEATRQLKAHPVTAGVPIVALTAHAMAGDRQRATDAGADDYDTKPVDIDRLMGKITALLPKAS